MSTTQTFRHKIDDETSDFAFRLPRALRQDMKLLADHSGWSEAELARRAVALFLRENRNLLQVIRAQEEIPNGR